MTVDELDDIAESVAYHREHGGYLMHNPVGARFCRCCACRLVRTFDHMTDERIRWERHVNGGSESTVDSGLPVDPDIGSPQDEPARSTPNDWRAGGQGAER